MDELIYTVGALTEGLKEYLETVYDQIWVQGEISGCTVAASGHAYFTLKDDKAVLSCVCWRHTRRRLRAPLTDGAQVQVRGKLSIYPPRGAYQLIVDDLRPVGVGLLQQRFEALKKMLFDEGLFDADRKRRMPALPRRIGVVTSPTGAAVRDFLRVLSRRFPNVHVTIAPAQVQGQAAAAEIVRGIQLLNRLAEADVIVLTRGGGSIEDLWAFNEEVVARAIVASKIPVVSAVGHEIDYTIADFVADLRAATPSAAAEQLLPRKVDLRERIDARQRRIATRLRQALALLRQRTRTLMVRLERGSPKGRMAVLRQRMDHALERMIQHLRERLRREEQRRRELQRRVARAPRVWLVEQRARLAGVTERVQRGQPAALLPGLRDRLAREQHRLAHQTRSLLAQRRARLRGLAQRIQALSPRSALDRGFGVVTTRDGRLVRGIGDVTAGERIGIAVRDGRVDAVVETTIPRSEPGS